MRADFSIPPTSTSINEIAKKRKVDTQTFVFSFICAVLVVFLRLRLALFDSIRRDFANFHLCSRSCLLFSRMISSYSRSNDWQGNKLDFFVQLPSLSSQYFHYFAAYKFYAFLFLFFTPFAEFWNRIEEASRQMKKQIARGKRSSVVRSLTRVNSTLSVFDVRNEIIFGCFWRSFQLWLRKVWRLSKEKGIRRTNYYF